MFSWQQIDRDKLSWINVVCFAYVLVSNFLYQSHCHSYPGRGHLKCELKNIRVWRQCHQRGADAKPLEGNLGRRPLEADDTFCLWEYAIVNRFQDACMIIRLNSIWNVGKINVEAAWWYCKQYCMPIRHKVGGRLPALPNRPRHQAVVVSKVENN